MNGFPYVTGIIATNQDGAIANDEGRPILHRTVYEDFDRVVFSKYMEEMIDGDTMIVSGENNFNQMKSILPYYIKAIVTSQTQTRFIRGSNCPMEGKMFECWKSYQYPMPIMDIFRVAMEAKCSKIMVLGGRHVYNMFSGHYSHLVHVQAETKPPENNLSYQPKTVRVVESWDRGTNLLPGLVGYEMNHLWHVPFDDGKIKVSIYDVRKEKL